MSRRFTWNVKFNAHSISTSDGTERSVPLTTFTPRQRDSYTHWIWGLVDSRDIFNMTVKQSHVTLNKNHAWMLILNDYIIQNTECQTKNNQHFPLIRIQEKKVLFTKAGMKKYTINREHFPIHKYSVLLLMAANTYWRHKTELQWHMIAECVSSQILKALI